METETIAVESAGLERSELEVQAAIRAATPQAPQTPIEEAVAPTNLEALTAFVTQTAVLFYLAESPHNPQIATYWDALHYIATSLSVGYANIFPVTPMGKAIGAAVMMVGPAMSARALDPAK